jgi:hypothetical protein
MAESSNSRAGSMPPMTSTTMSARVTRSAASVVKRLGIDR